MANTIRKANFDGTNVTTVLDMGVDGHGKQAP